MFRGAYRVAMDGKGRMALPTRVRELLAEAGTTQLVATIDTQSRCLLVYPLVEWEAIQAKIETLSSFNAATRRIQRLLIGHAADLELDGSGRIVLPPVLRDYARLDRQVVLVGQGKKLEVWDLAAWEAEREVWLADNREAEEVPAELINLSL